MNQIIFLAAVAIALPAIVHAQDDLYFVPTKKAVKESGKDFGLPRNTYYRGSHRSVDDYNRRQKGMSRVETIDSTGNVVTEYAGGDIIDFDGEVGRYPDTEAIDSAFSVSPEEDYECTRKMSRFDDYAWQEGFRDGLYAGRTRSWYWGDPWYWDYPYFGYYAWGYPYYYGSWYWNDPWYWGGWHGYHHFYGGYLAGEHSHRPSGGARFSRGGFRGYRGNANDTQSGMHRVNGSSRTYNSNFGGRRNVTNTNTASRTYSPPANSGVGTGSFGGLRGGGGFVGGSRGGGSFGGRR